MDTKHDEELREIFCIHKSHHPFIWIQKKFCHKCSHKTRCDNLIQQIKDAGFIHKNEIELDEDKIVELLPGSSAIKGPFNKRNINISYQQHAGQDCIYGSIILEDVAHDIAEAKEKIIK